MARRRAQACYFCNQEIASSEVITHINQCDSASTCEYCQGRVPLAMFRAHSAVCDRAPVQKARFNAAMTLVQCLECFKSMPFPNLGYHLAEHEDRLKNAVLFTFDKTCPLCLDIFAEGVKVYVLNCGHMFHDSCLTRWTSLNKSCPTCRQVVS